MPPGQSHAPLRVIFAGTPAFAVPALQALVGTTDVTVVAVYTQPDRAAGRGRQLRESEVKRCALDHGLEVVQPQTWRDPDVLAAIRASVPDLLVVAAYGLILPAESLTLPRLGSVNLHASLLPRWRGAAPIQRAIMAGDEVSGVTLMRVVPALDAGPMLARVTCPIAPNETAGHLEARLAQLAADLLIEALPALAAGALPEEPQDPEEVTYAAKLTREDRALDWSCSARVLERRIRALQPTPQAITHIAGMECAVVSAEVRDEASATPPGTVLRCSTEGVEMATGDGVLRITSLQPAGKRALSAREFFNGYATRLGLGAG
jgi:methionyl-tRNA formyltransferase